MKLVIFGAPGSGKGTISARIKKDFSVAHISGGEIFRQEIKNGGVLGRQVEEYVSRGMLVPDDIVIEVMQKRLEQTDTKNGFILDGFPRTKAQAEALEKIIEIDKVILIDLDADEVVNRLVSRRMCKVCGGITNTKWLINGKCERCGGEVYLREDDKEDIVKGRLKEYETLSEPIIDYYKARGKLFTVKSNDDLEKNYQEVRKIIQT